ncbi:MAG: thioredoxin [Bacteroidales bacterium]|nr:thioredoxin [Bacteroidales bacterium]
MKNFPLTPDNEKIKKLTKNNFKAQTKKGVVLVDFWAPWCGPCKMMAPILNEMAEEVAEGVSIAKVNVDEQQELAQTYGIRSIPTLVMFKDGKAINRFTGVKTKSALMKHVNEVL